jgi:hypothetical protein
MKYSNNDLRSMLTFAFRLEVIPLFFLCRNYISFLVAIIALTLINMQFENIYYKNLIQIIQKSKRFNMRLYVFYPCINAIIITLILEFMNIVFGLLNFFDNRIDWYVTIDMYHIKAYLKAFLFLWFYLSTARLMAFFPLTLIMQRHSKKMKNEHK